MRVITGTARGRKLREPTGGAIRPTGDMVKESMFSIIQFDIEGRRVLDLFAGTGQLGIEAYSRGALAVTFVDESIEAIRLINENLRICQMQATVVRDNALSFISRCGNSEKFDLIFLDPPHGDPVMAEVLQKIIKFDILSDGGIIICETERGFDMPDLKPPYFIGREYRYGRTKLTVCGKNTADAQA